MSTAFKKRTPAAVVASLSIGAGIGFGFVFGASSIAFSPAAASALTAAINAVTSCSSTSACIGGTNAGTGPGVSGKSTRAAGVVGTGSTYGGQFTGNTGAIATGKLNGGAGIQGVDASQYDGQAVYGHSTSNQGYGVHGSATGSGAGVGVVGESSTGDGAEFYADGNGRAVYAQSASGGIAGEFISECCYGNGTGVYAQSQGIAGQFVDQAGSGSLALDVVSGTTGEGAAIMTVASSDNSQQMTFTDQGNLSITGDIYANNTCNEGCAVHRVRAYASTESEPTIEDVGKANLIGGTADVAIDPKFANVIDEKSDYAVLVTPEGDSNGLYVAQRSMRGFVVRENRGGHSSVPFSYRIVAKPFGKAQPRLPMVALSPKANLPALATQRPHAPSH